MVVQDRKLDALTSVLTPRQRAILFATAWLKGDEPDERLRRLCPPQDSDALDTMIRAIAKGNNELQGTLNHIFEWVAQTEAEIHWLRILEMYQRRDKAIPQSVRKTLPSLSRPWDMTRQTHRTFGVALTRNEPDAATWEQVESRLVRDTVDGIQHRWQDYLQAEHALEEASAAFGMDVTHHEFRGVLDHLREDILRLKELMSEAGHKVELPEYDSDVVSYARGAFKLEVLRDVPAEKHAREWMHDQVRRELEEWERQQAEKLRADR